MKFDDVLREIGEFGAYQKRVYFLATLPLILSAFEAMSVVFIFHIPPHRCAIPHDPNDHYHVTNDTHLDALNDTIPREEDGTWSKCQVYSDVFPDVTLANHSNGIAEGYDFAGETSTCDRWVYDYSVFESTIPEEHVTVLCPMFDIAREVSVHVFDIARDGSVHVFDIALFDMSTCRFCAQFDIVCDRSVYRASSNMMAEIGCLVGTLLCGFLADRFGRKIPFYLGGLTLIAGGFGIAFSPSLPILNICRFIIGVARMTLMVNGLVLGMEMVGPSKRVFAGTFIEVMWCVGLFLLLPIAYLVRHWRYLEIALSVPSVVLLAYWWLLPESPRWLAAKGRKEEALKVLEKITASNRTTLPRVDDVTQLLEAERTLSFRHVLQSRELVVRVLILFCNMFVLVLNYYALTYNITNLTGDVFVNFLMNSIMETVGLTAPYFVLDRFGRRRIYCGSIFIGGLASVGCVLPGLLGGPDWVIVALALAGRLFVCIAFSTLYTYGAELFPTVVRASTMGVGVTFSRLGGIAGPYIADMGFLVGGELKEALPLIVMGVPALFVGLLSLRLPETMGTKLPETLDDVDRVTRSMDDVCVLCDNDCG
ncbi:organic cation transporter protein-like [Babylonia areolata]|uniref:organic cation transporter protein-like n=1 Tax=Babylonia areolata TaxID=304850 RepID=UPI003FD08F4C